MEDLGPQNDLRIDVSNVMCSITKTMPLLQILVIGYLKYKKLVSS